MANQNHLLLLEDVELWNQWRQRQPEIIPDLSGANLQGKELQGINLSQTNLIEVNLSNTNLTEANLSKASLRKANLRGSNIRRANLYQTFLTEADLTGAYISQSDLSKVTLCGANCTSANLSESYLIGAKLRNAIFRKADLSGAFLTEADLIGADFYGANLSQVDLTKVEAVQADFTKANLSGICFSSWNIDQTTKLEEVYCTYLRLNNEEKRFINSSLSQTINLRESLDKLNYLERLENSQPATNTGNKSDQINLSQQAINPQVIEWKKKLQQLKQQKKLLDQEISQLELRLKNDFTLTP
jgi:uncharacterized protein YjbI with pentapeptide repeats